MAAVSVEQFLEILERSRLLDASQLAEAGELATAYAADENAQDFADRLVREQLITEWQADKLVEGKYKGFFLGKYKLLRHISTGGMSSVFLAEHRLMKRRRAIKVLPRQKVKDSTYLARFRREAQATAALKHPNVVRAYDIDNVGDVHYIVMEYVDGPDLQQRVKNQGPLDPRQAATYIAQAAVGLSHAHDLGLYHRDVKPGNLLIDPNDDIKVLDLGLALFSADDEASLTVAFNEKVLGTADYLAPEQALNSHNIDHRADIYGLGCTMYFALTGKAPFGEGSIAQRIARHQSMMPEPLSEHRSDVEPALEAICFQMMQKKPAHRFQTMREVADVLNAWLAADVVAVEEKLNAVRQLAAVASGGGIAVDDGRSVPFRLLDEDQLGHVGSPADTVSNQLDDTQKGLESRTELAATSDVNETPPLALAAEQRAWYDPANWMWAGIAAGTVIALGGVGLWFLM